MRLVDTFFLARSSNAMVAVVADGRWRPGIGDPTAVGWATVVLYALAAALCAYAAVQARRQGSGGGNGDRGLALWSCLALLMLALGVNKQLDLQMWLWLTWRNLAKAHSLYEHRQAIQMGLMMGFAAFAGAITAYAALKARRFSASGFLAATGAAFLFVFVAARAVSLHDFDRLLGSTVWRLTLNQVLELTGVVFVGAAAAARLLGARTLALLKRTRQKPPPRQKREKQRPKYTYR